MQSLRKSCSLSKHNLSPNPLRSCTRNEIGCRATWEDRPQLANWRSSSYLTVKSPYHSSYESSCQEKKFFLPSGETWMW
jgi:hypothetical protein